MNIIQSIDSTAHGHLSCFWSGTILNSMFINIFCTYTMMHTCIHFCWHIPRNGILSTPSLMIPLDSISVCPAPRDYWSSIHTGNLFDTTSCLASWKISWGENICQLFISPFCAFLFFIQDLGPLSPLCLDRSLMSTAWSFLCFVWHF